MDIKRKSLRLFVLILAIFAIPNLSLLSQEMTIQEIIEDASSSVVKIVVYDKAGEFSGCATGFYIDLGKILTNAHVVDGAYSLKVLSDYDGSEGFCFKRVKILKVDEDVDLALLEIRNKHHSRLQLEADQEILPGQPVITLGFPLGYYKSVSDGLISNYKNWDTEFGFTAPVSQGNSGSPLLNLKGNVVGIYSNSIKNGRDLHFAVNLKTIKEFLSMSDTPQELPPAESSIKFWVIFNKAKNIALPGFNFTSAVGKWIFFASLKFLSFLFFLFLSVMALKLIIKISKKLLFIKISRKAVLITGTFILDISGLAATILLLDRYNQAHLFNPSVQIGLAVFFGSLTYFSLRIVWKMSNAKTKRLDPAIEKIRQYLY